ncbi:MAG: DinB family protein [Caldilineaceae bacterium]
MTQSDLLTILQHHYWANHRILECATQVSVEQLMQAANFDHESAFQTLRHMLDVEWSWRLMAQRVLATELLWNLEDLSDLEKLKAFWRLEQETMVAYVRSMDEATINSNVEFGTPQGRPPQSAKLWQIVVHLAVHGTHHRSELARYFTDCGHSPGDINFMDFLFEQRKVDVSILVT